MAVESWNVWPSMLIFRSFSRAFKVPRNDPMSPRSCLGQFLIYAVDGEEILTFRRANVNRGVYEVIWEEDELDNITPIGEDSRKQ